MYSIDKTSYGLRLTFGGLILISEMERWLSDIKKLSLPLKFKVLVDMKELKPVRKEAEHVIKEGQIYLKKRGMEKSAVVIGDPITALQFGRIGKVSGIDSTEKIINTNKTPNYEQEVMQWLMK